jgi:hypothetical protein
MNETFTEFEFGHVGPPEFTRPRTHRIQFKFDIERQLIK